MRPAVRPANWLSGGFTLTELLVVIAIIGIVAGIAGPSFREAIDKYRLKGAADLLMSDLQYARLAALKANQTVYVNFSTGSSWCYGMKMGTTCTCSTPGSCDLKQVNAADFKDTTLSTSTFAADPGFDPVRGLATNSGNVVMQSSFGKEVQINLNLLGKIGICTPASSNGVGYATC